MDWQSDPYLARLEMERRARNGLLKTAIIWTPLFLIAFGGLLWALIGKLFFDGGATWFLIVVLSILSFLFGFQCIQAIRDLIGGERKTEGLVTRRWSRTDSFVMRSHYIRLDTKQIFRIDQVFHDEAKAGRYVQVRYYPHTSVVIEAEWVKDEDEDQEGGEARDRERETRWESGRQ